MYRALSLVLGSAAALGGAEACPTWNETTGVPLISAKGEFGVRPLNGSEFSSSAEGAIADYAAIIVPTANRTFLDITCPSDMEKITKGLNQGCASFNVTAEEFSSAVAGIEVETFLLPLGGIGYGYGEYQIAGGCPVRPFGDDGIVFGVERAGAADSSTALDLYQIPPKSTLAGYGLDFSVGCEVTTALPSSGIPLTILNETPGSVRVVDVTSSGIGIAYSQDITLFNGASNNTVLLDCDGPIPTIGVCTEGVIYSPSTEGMQGGEGMAGETASVNCTLVKALTDSSEPASLVRIHTSGYFPSEGSAPADEVISLAPGEVVSRTYASSLPITPFQIIMASSASSGWESLYTGQNGVFVTCVQNC
jgi:hypothetical protein